MFLIPSKPCFLSLVNLVFPFAKFTLGPGFSLCWKIRVVNVQLLCLFSSTFHENTLHKSRHYLSKHLTRKARLWRNWRNVRSVLPCYQVCQEWTTRIQKQSIDLLYRAVKSRDQMYTLKFSDAWGWWGKKRWNWEYFQAPILLFATFDRAKDQNYCNVIEMILYLL